MALRIVLRTVNYFFIRIFISSLIPWTLDMRDTTATHFPPKYTTSSGLYMPDALSLVYYLTW